MDQYYSPSTGGFYNEAIHGARMIAETLTERQIKAGRQPKFLPNPLCRIPPDAKLVSKAEWERLMAAQGEGKVIAVLVDRVVAVDPAPSTAQEQMAAIRARRDRLLAATDPMVTVPDYPIAEDRRAELLAWRAALRDFPAEVEPLLPADTTNLWPPRPLWLGENGELL